MRFFGQDVYGSFAIGRLLASEVEKIRERRKGYSSTEAVQQLARTAERRALIDAWKKHGTSHGEEDSGLDSY